MKKTARKKDEGIEVVKPDLGEDLIPEEKSEDKGNITESEAIDQPESAIDTYGKDEEREESENEPDDSSFYEKVMGQKPPKKSEQSSNDAPRANSKLFLLGGFVFVLTVLISSMVWLSILNNSQKIKMVPDDVSKKIAPTPSPSIEPMVTFARDDWSFEVLNGGNTPGAAAKAADKIKAIGYKVAKIGNADSSVDTTQIYVSSEATAQQKSSILSDLKKDFGDLTFTDTFSTKHTVRIILGGK